MDNLEWMNQAACRHGDPHKFFPTDGDAGEAGKALHICRAHCPVQPQCETRRQQLNLKTGVIGGQHWVIIGSRPRISPATRPTAEGCEHGCPPYRKQHTTCPTCGTVIAGLMTGCHKPLCRSADIADDHTHVRRNDR